MSTTDRPAGLSERWNKEHPNDQFENYRHFRTYFTRGAEEVKAASFS